MELLIPFVIGLLITIFVLPFLAIAKANAAKRSLDDLLTRLSTVENELRNLRRQTGSDAKPEAAEKSEKQTASGGWLKLPKKVERYVVAFAAEGMVAMMAKLVSKPATR